MECQIYSTHQAKLNIKSEELEPVWEYLSIPVKDTLVYIRMNITELSNVKQLASKMGYSRGHFSKIVKEFFHKSPQELLWEERFRRIKMEIRKYPYETSCSIAGRVGLKGGDKSMYKFR